MQCSMTSAVAARIATGLGSVSPVRTSASAAASRRAAATTKWPLPTAGSTTVSLQQRFLSIVLGWGGEGFGDEGVEGFGEDDVDQFGGRVVGAGLLPLVAGGDGEGEGVVGGVVARGVGEQPFVHAAEFFAVEVAVVDRARGAGHRVVDLGQCSDGGEEGVVGQAGVVEDAEEVAAEQRRARGREARGRAGRHRPGRR